MVVSGSGGARGGVAAGSVSSPSLSSETPGAGGRGAGGLTPSLSLSSEAPGAGGGGAVLFGGNADDADGRGGGGAVRGAAGAVPVAHALAQPGGMALHRLWHSIVDAAHAANLGEGAGCPRGLGRGAVA